VPLKQVARGSSLTQSTRQVVQSVGVAILATVLASSLSPQIAALQQRILEQPRENGASPVALCEPAPSFTGGGENPALGSPAGRPPVPGASLGEACRENVNGFENTYRITFYAAIVALVLGLMLPGWPRKWAGRRAADAPPQPTELS